jgi:hypothetical protein
MKLARPVNRAPANGVTLVVSEDGGAAGHCPTLGPKIGFAGPPYAVNARPTR